MGLEYLQEPINVLLFDKRFRRARPELDEDAILVGFKQGKKHWTATYQDDQISIAFEGNTAKTVGWLIAEAKGE